MAVHASPDAPAVDLLADVVGTPDNEAWGSRATSPSAGLPYSHRPGAGELQHQRDAGRQPGVVALKFPVQAEKDELTAIVTGYLGSTPALRPLASSAVTRSIVTEARLRVTHASPGTGNVDLYLLPDGADLATASAGFAAVHVRRRQGVLSLAPGAYDVYVTPAGNKSVVAIEVQNLALSGGAVLEVIARDANQNGSEGALPQLIVVDYANVSVCPTDRSQRTGKRRAAPAVRR